MWVCIESVFVVDGFRARLILSILLMSPLDQTQLPAQQIMQKIQQPQRHRIPRGMNIARRITVAVLSVLLSLHETKMSSTGHSNKQAM